jgi:hypothetical protein
LLTAFGGVPAVASEAPGLLLRKLDSLAGSGAQDCGAIPLNADRDAALGCARGADAGAKPWRMAFEVKATDSYTWQGAARDREGRVWAVYFDADTTADTGASPSLGVLLCVAITFSAVADEPIDCTPATGPQQPPPKSA